jgi:hypothetical protein
MAVPARTCHAGIRADARHRSAFPPSRPRNGDKPGWLRQRPVCPNRRVVRILVGPGDDSGTLSSNHAAQQRYRTLRVRAGFGVVDPRRPRQKHRTRLRHHRTRRRHARQHPTRRPGRMALPTGNPHLCRHSRRNHLRRRRPAPSKRRRADSRFHRTGLTFRRIVHSRRPWPLLGEQFWGGGWVGGILQFSANSTRPA